MPQFVAAPRRNRYGDAAILGVHRGNLLMSLFIFALLRLLKAPRTG
jgi:hypothetical protein